MPLEHLLEDALSVAFDHVAVTSDDALKIPVVDPGNRLGEALSVARAGSIPNSALLPDCTSFRTLQRTKDLGQDPSGRVDTGLAVLLGSREVEHEIGRDKGARRLVMEEDFLVQVGGNVLPLELGIELRRDCLDRFRLVEDEGERNVLVILLRALLRKSLGAEYLCVGVGLMPGTEEDVVLSDLVIV